MWVKPMAVSLHALQITLSDEDFELLQVFAGEQGISDLTDAVGPLLHEYIRVVDALWDEKLARPNPALDALITQVEAEISAGLTEDFDFDDDFIEE
jgi:hypothetical protein